MAHYSPSILMLQETRLAAPPTSSRHLRDYTVFSAHSPTESKRGLLLAVSKSVPVVRFEEVMVVSGSVLIIRAICTPPLQDLLLVNYHGQSVMEDTDRLDCILATLSRFPKLLHIVGGDFNMALSNSEIQLLESGSYLPGNCRSSLSTFMRHGQLVCGKYRTSPISRYDWSRLSTVRPSALDLILLSSTNIKAIDTTETLSSFVGSDHIPVRLSLNIAACIRPIR